MHNASAKLGLRSREQKQKSCGNFASNRWRRSLGLTKGRLGAYQILMCWSKVYEQKSGISRWNAMMRWHACGASLRRMTRRSLKFTNSSSK